MADQDARQRATRRVEAKLSFYVHLTVYLAVGAFLVIVNLSTSTDYLWVKWPLMGWGVAILLHGLSVFVFNGRSSVTERMIEREMRKGGSDG